MRIFLNNGSEDMSVGMSNLWVTKMGDIKPTGADGHFEVDFAMECLPQDGAIEWKQRWTRRKVESKERVQEVILYNVFP